MKIIFTGDNHIFYGHQHKAVRGLMEKIRKENPDVVCNVGDIGEVLIVEDTTLVQEMFSIQPTIFVLGNHDLYSHLGYNPIKSMDECLKKMRWGIPLQTYWGDTKTSYEKNNCLFLGTIGFPDFSNPKMLKPIKYYDGIYPTVDGTYINLKGGWLQYTLPLLDAFEKKLALIDSSPCSNVVIITHYSIFESQYNLSYTEDISAFFYCHKLGQLVLQASQKHPNKKFYCISGHGHEYNVGKWVQQDNVFSHGLATTYFDQNYISLEIPSIND